jgi:hypothetical protein
MQITRIASAILLALATSAHGQVLLNTGDVFTYSFKAIPSTGPGSCSGEAPAGGFNLNLAPDSFNANEDVLFVEMFENDTKEAPLTTFVAESFADGIALSDAWADFQGTVRFTMVSGSVILQRLSFFRKTPLEADTCNTYELAVVPRAHPASSRTLITIQGSVSQGPNAPVIQLGARLSGQLIDSLEFAPVEGDGSLKSSSSSPGKADAPASCQFSLEGEVIREDQLVTVRGLVRSSPDRRLIGARVVIGVSFSEGSNEPTGVELFFYPHPGSTEPPIEFYGQAVVTTRQVGPE